MKHMARLLYCMAVAFITLSMNAAINLPKVEILGKKYYVYTVKKGDSLFGISRDYNWNYSELQRLNPKAISPLEKGLKIYYPSDNEDQESAIQVEAIDGNIITPVSHVVKRGETVYGISRMYKIPEETIYRLNPSSKKGIREGEVLKLQIEQSVDEAGGAPIYYTVKKGDTLYGVARAYDTTVAEIMKQNPGVSEKNFREGATIRLPQKGAGIKKTTTTVTEERLESFSSYKVEKKDTWDTISAKTGVDKDDLMEANQSKGGKPKNKSLITVPNIEEVTVEKVIVDEDPREMTADGIASIYDDVHGISDSTSFGTIKVVLLLSEPTTRKDLEFSRGFLSGVDKLKGGNTKIDLTILDGNRPSTEVLEKLSEITPDILFLTTEKGIPTYLSEYAEISQTPMVNTFDVKNELYTRNPYVVQLLTPSSYFNEEVAARIVSDYKDYNLIFVGDEDSSDQVASSLKQNWTGRNSKVVSIDELKGMSLKDNEKYLFYGYPAKKDNVVELLDALESIKSLSPLAETVLVGRPAWIVYEESEKDKFHKNNVIIPSRFYFDKDSNQARVFVNYYKSLFDRQPAMSFPMYAAVGYDSALYFINGLSKAGKDVNYIGASSPGAQSDFNLVRPNNWTGLMNPVVYLVRFTPYNTVEKILTTNQQ